MSFGYVEANTCCLLWPRSLIRNGSLPFQTEGTLWVKVNEKGILFSSWKWLYPPDWTLLKSENCVLLGYYAACSCNSSSTFRNNLSVPTLWRKPEFLHSVKDCLYSSYLELRAPIQYLRQSLYNSHGKVQLNIYNHPRSRFWRWAFCHLFGVAN